jgi:hypothetical protein
METAMANDANVAHMYGSIPSWVWFPESTSKVWILDSELVTENFAIVHGEGEGKGNWLPVREISIRLP